MSSKTIDDQEAAKARAVESYRGMADIYTGRVDVLTCFYRSEFARWLVSEFGYNEDNLCNFIEKPCKWDAEFKRYLLWVALECPVDYLCECGERIDWTDDRCLECGAKAYGND